jgi:hypothetical protein
MEPLPKGANFVRAKTLWEIGLHLAGNPTTLWRQSRYDHHNRQRLRRDLPALA